MKTIILYLTIILIFITFDSSAQIQILSNGNVGMGLNTPTPAYKLDIVSGESRFSNFRITHWGTDPRLCATSSITFYRLDGTGYANIECQVLTQSSDSTLKNNITDLDETCLTTVKQLKGASYNWKNDKNKALQSGFLAQELEKVIPEAVFTHESTKQKSIEYSFILPYLVEATKELERQIAKLKSEAEILEQKYQGGDTKDLTIYATNEKAISEGLLYDALINQETGKTQLNCYIPDNASSSSLYIYNQKGTQQLRFKIEGKGMQSVMIENERLAAGKYLYALIVDGKELGMKNLTIIR